MGEGRYKKKALAKTRLDPAIPPRSNGNNGQEVSWRSPTPKTTHPIKVQSDISRYSKKNFLNFTRRYAKYNIVKLGMDPLTLRPLTFSTYLFPS